MFTHLLIWIFQFCLFIPKAYSFRTPKHDIAFYYKTHASVFLTNPDNHATSYGIYVAGKTIKMNIPKSVVNVSDILDWKVVNLIEDRLMFVHKNKPYILIYQQRIKKMNYSGELSDSIIAFGDNEALHVPTIFNPNLTKPVYKWNYIELLYFDDKNEKISVLRSLPWLKDDDWKFIKEWKMMDYIHFDNKLYLLIKRSISDEKNSNVTQEISIIQFCLDKGSELISSAVEVHFTRPEFITNQIIDLIFVFIFGPHETEYDRYQLHTTQLRPSNNTKIYDIYFLRDIVSLFAETAIECSSASDKSTLLRHYLRSEVGECKKTSHKSCSTMENIVPSRNVSDILTGRYVFYSLFDSRATLVQKIQFVTLPYPHLKRNILLHTNPIIYSAICEYHPAPAQCLNLGTINSHLLIISAQVNFYINKHPIGFFYVEKETNENLFIPIEVCSNLKTCTQCIIYGFYSDCIWSNSICVHDNQPKNKAVITVNNCFKVIAISPLVFNSSLPTRLTIQLDKPLIKDDQEQLVIQAGDNHCTDITTNEVFINCSLHLTKSGHFKIDVSLRSDRYADTVVISAVSTKKIYIVVSKSRYTISILFVIFSIFTIFLLITYTNYNKKHGNEFLEVKRSTRIMNIASKSMKSKKFSRSRKRSPSTTKIIVTIQSK
uniref:Sema domain-containing protein n=1 Tax=Tetranychus urticae TaxID=32264 RepID=T1L6D0_TETUR